MRRIFITITLLLIVAFSVFIRFDYPSSWLKGETMRFSTVDAYYQARIVEILKTHTELPTTDPYFGYNDTNTISKKTTPILWPYTIHTIAQTLDKLGISDSVDVTCYTLPPIIAGLTILGVFLITALVFNAWAGLFAVFLMGTMGGEYFGRSIAGASDYHVFETFLLVYFILFIISAVKSPRFSILFAILAGLMAACYCKAWYGGGYVFVIATVAYVIYLISLSLKKQTPDGHIFNLLLATLASSILFYVLIVSLTGTFIDNSTLVIIFVCFTAVLFTTIIHSITINNHPLIFPSICILVGLLCLVCISLFANTYFSAIMAYLNPLLWWNTETRTAEEMPILFSDQGLTLYYLWGNFTVGFFLCLLVAGMLVRRLINSPKHDTFNYIFLLIGAIIMIMSTFAMRRFAYYSIIYISIMAGYFVYIIIPIVAEHFKRNKQKLKWYDKTGDIVLVLIIFIMVFVPNLVIANQMRYPLPGSITTGWESGLLWLKANSPEPFTHNYYYADYNDDIRKANYSVMSWWDYGYWITYISHRVPVCNPGSINRYESAAFFTTTDTSGATKVLDSVQSKYVIVDYAMVTGKFTAMPTYADASTIDLKVSAGLGETKHDYIGIYNIGEFYQSKGDAVQQTMVFYPDYYKSMAVRLFNFNGMPVTSAGCLVIVYQEGNDMKWIEAIIDCPSYDDAVAYTKHNTLPENKKYAIGGIDPFVSCVDLNGIQDTYRLVYQSGLVELKFLNTYQLPEVKIFEVVQ